MCLEHIELKKNVLADNDEAAGRLRQAFGESGTFMVNMISSPGSGKTSLVEATAASLRDRLELGALVGDVATEMDAERIRGAGIAARQILTGGACHLDARQVSHALSHWGGEMPGILMVENVGNLVCPAAYDLGEDLRAILLSVTEGDDKPFKYPAAFSGAEAVVITKSDLLPHVRFDLERVRERALTLSPDAVFMVTSAVTGEGLDAWCGLLEERALEKRGAGEGVSRSAASDRREASRESWRRPPGS
jgi:hydrogenase nickel incorporation protein HypB